MEPRYQTKKMADLLTKKHRQYMWYAVLKQRAVIRADFRQIPRRALSALRDAGCPTPQLVARYETKYDHDVAGFVGALESKIPAGFHPYVYQGMTSSDLVDSANAIIYRDALNVIRDSVTELQDELRARARMLEGRGQVGRTHGQAAEVVSAAAWLHRGSMHLEGVERSVRPRFYFKFAGPVGGDWTLMTSAERQFAVEFAKWAGPGVEPDPNPSQITSRLEYATLAFKCTQYVAVCESIATRIRLAQQTGVGEIREGFRQGQRGSSSMPAKRNPIKAERICGLARVARGLLHPIVETYGAMWSERDISNSSVERVALDDLLQLTHFILEQTVALVRNAEWDLDAIQAAVDAHRSSAAEFNEAVAAGEDRDAAYARIQQAATR